MKNYSRVCARINLNAIDFNFESMKKNISSDTKMIAVIKTDGYGHGACQIAELLEPKAYVWGFAVATLDEALVLRKRKIKKPILVLGCIFPEQWEAMLDHEIRCTVYSAELAGRISEMAVSKGGRAFIHIKLDTGMSRLGFPISDAGIQDIIQIHSMPGLVMEGMYTHFAKADETDKTFTDDQIEKYLHMRKELEKAGVTFDLYHCSNSAGIIDVRRANMDAVRAGISIYGLYPSEEVDKNAVPLKPALELISHVAFVKTVPAGTPVSYGGTYVTEREMKLATIPVGYGDGYPRSLSDKGYVLIRGKKALIRGRVCMDQMMVDVTDIPGVAFGDEVVLVGKSQDEFLPVETLSDLSGRFNYEFVCDLGKRIPREFFLNGEIVEQMDAF